MLLAQRLHEALDELAQEAPDRVVPRVVEQEGTGRGGQEVQELSDPVWTIPKTRTKVAFPLVRERDLFERDLGQRRHASLRHL